MWLARDEDDELWLYLYDEPTKLENCGLFRNNTIGYINQAAIHIEETDDKYKDITWENSPVELTYKL